MKKSKKIVCLLIIAVILSMFALKTTVYADVVDPYWSSHTKSNSGTDIDSDTLIKIIIVLVSIILIMSVIILKYIYNKYKLEVKLVRRDAQTVGQGSVGAKVNFTESQEFKDELGENVMEETQKDVNNSNNENVRIEMDMTKLFAAMILIVGIIIIVSVMS